MSEFRWYKRIGKLLPGRLVNYFDQLLIYAGLDIHGDDWLGFVLVFSVLSMIAGVMVTYVITQDARISAGLGVVLGVGVAVLNYVWILIREDRRTTFVESVLPDMLSLVVANMRSGMTPEKAMIVSSRDEFGILSQEIRLSLKKTITGESFIEALSYVATRINSESLKQTVSLLTEGIRSGGELATLLEESSQNVRNLQLMKQEIRASIVMYIIFIFIAIGLASPLLYGISIYLTSTIGNMVASIDIPPDVLESSFIKLSGSDVSIPFLIQFSTINLIIGSIMGGLIIGMIEGGSAKKGFKYVPLLLVISLSIFYAIQIVLTQSLGTFQ